ncbi:MAG TPA: zf-HC2 domain-containing protein [Pyrinomonadaceae bacterium]|nr:zf-HC2 domain-containing protein [Pyrinomonadaceae bacterium]
MSTATEEKICERNLIGAYVDGELDADLTVLLEDHLESCADCRFELRAHRLFVCELDAALTGSGDDEVPVPRDFSRIIATRATTDMRGVRTRSENRKAFTICVILALGGFALLGATALNSVFLIAQKFVATVFGLAGLVGTAVYDIAAGLVVIFRVVSRKYIIETGSLWPMLVLLAFGFLILSRLISHYHRSGATE